MPCRHVIEPGATLGVFGGGQLGRMFAMAAMRMGYHVHVFTPQADSPTGQIATRSFVANYEDADAVRTFARSVDAVTFEFENVPTQAVKLARQHAPVRPAGSVLHTAQHRLREKDALRQAGLPVTPYLPVRSLGQLRAGLEDLGGAAVLKTAAWGYDGKGQRMLGHRDQADDAWATLGPGELILEQAIDFECELSVIAARGLDGQVACYDPVENVHRDHILDVSLCPARVPETVRDEAIAIAQRLMAALEVTGVLCVEFFLAPGGRLLINEIAPRPHNSGHLTIDACATSQFEQQVRAVCGLPLGSTRLLRPAAMVNLLGDLWTDGPPRWASALATADVRLHLYGKDQPRPGRKMGHLTAVGEDVDHAARRVRQARQALRAAAETTLTA